MKVPFTQEQFLEVFRNYNIGVWPAQVLFYLLALAAVILVFRKNIHSGKIIVSILVALWLWMGIVYHLIYFTTINNAAYLFGIVFILQAILLIYYGWVQKKLSFSFRPGINGLMGFFLVTFALVVYPLLGSLLGHNYPASPTFGLPCPTTIFTFGMFLFIDRKYPVVILIIPLLWSVVGFTAAVSLGIVEDVSLLITGLIMIILQIRSRYETKKIGVQH